MTGKGSGRRGRSGSSNGLLDGGQILVIFGLIMFLLPRFGRSLVITSWLGDMEQPLGLAMLVVGVPLLAVGLLRRSRGASVVVPTADPAIAPPPGPVATPGPASMSRAGVPLRPTAAPPAGPGMGLPVTPGERLEADPPPLEPIYRPPISLADLDRPTDG